MFTGLVQALGTVSNIAHDGHGGLRLEVREPSIARLAVLGESIAVNGACLTVIDTTVETFSFQAGPETLARTALADLELGAKVNLERALRVGDSIGGHFVTGHIDVVGTISKIELNGDWRTFWFEFSPGYDDVIIEKGSIAINGISLTVVACHPGRISVMVIPHTLQATTLGSSTVGTRVNLEFDLLAKHVRKLIRNPSIDI